jgi:hypothetical protein
VLERSTEEYVLDHRRASSKELRAQTFAPMASNFSFRNASLCQSGGGLLMKVYCRRVVATIGSLLSVAALAPMCADAYDPVPALRTLYGAPHAVVWLLQVKAGRETQFVNAMVQSGPYNKLLSGFASEKLLEPLPVAQGTRVYLSFSRYYDTGTAEYVEPERLRGIAEDLDRPPVRVKLSLVEHLVADWGWEKGTKQSVLQTKPFKNDEIFQKNISSLSFFKSGYVGQVGVVEFFKPGVNLNAVRARVTARGGLSGASIYKVDGSDRYVAYSEFFKAPKDVVAEGVSIAQSAIPLGAVAGVVVQNYSPR